MKTSEREVLKGYYWNHDAIRKDAERLKNVSAQVDHFTAADFQQIIKWFRFHEFAIITHHRAEDEFFFPVIAERTGTFDRELSKFDEEHKELDRLMIEVEKLLRRLGDNEDTERDALKTAITDYVNLVTGHLDSEEQVVEQAVDANFSKEEVLEAEAQFRQNMPREKMIKLMPWLVDAMDDSDRKFFFSQLPFMPRLMYKLSLRGKFNRMVRPVS